MYIVYIMNEQAELRECPYYTSIGGSNKPAQVWAVPQNTGEPIRTETQPQLHV